MRLIIVTQKVDKNDPILGFFHRWLQEFAMHCERVDVITQFVGEHQLPSNVSIHSLRKERGNPRWLQIIRFWRLLRWRSADADALFVHMTPIWLVLAGPILCARRLPAYLWYEARGGGWALPTAVTFARKVFSASKSGMPIQTSKSLVVGHGIDTAAYVPDAVKRDAHQLVTVGRITSSKKLPKIIEALSQLPSEYHLRIAGVPVTEADRVLADNLRGEMEALRVQTRVEVAPASPAQVIPLLQHSSLFLHASVTGLDKALLEAMACGCMVISSSDAAKDLLPAQCLATSDQLGARAKELVSLPVSEQDALRHQLRQLIVQHHSLPGLIRRLVDEMQVR
jgi:glycosyltransferase involved in cell wall biosynthesis